ncbi:NAD(P)/FAD-dependent oxidoreductase [Arundinibacter roseus]|uniref:NAD(P)/FAD-dependent oxidoreductase n=1 Tax=Arundinibacter roseus TaxID=2070510 RepID=A0A4R4KNK6_9BACT|nr:FAD-dependent oxidoreductase [Arundinibacter roseus]TDB68151.1 NAD(P)/FAD-dependent oxidoreductase [Arundinibacter roseus]
MKHIVILGNGISGITAARHIRKHSDFRITVISGETEHFFSRTALMYIYMGHMKYQHTKPYEDFFWAKNRIELKKAWVKTIDFDTKTLHFETPETMQYDQLILAVGSSINRFGWPGQELAGVQGLYSYQDLELMEANTAAVTSAVIVGGGLIGIEMAEMLLTRNIPVTFLVREKSYWNNVLPEEESALIGRHIEEHGVKLRLSTELAEIIPDENGRVKAIKTTTNEQIECQFVGLAVGVHPNLSLLKDTKLETDRGILVNEFLETNLPDVYAIGDCVQHRTPQQDRKSVEQIWYTGRIMGETVARTICGERTAYQPGVFFNSAKFFAIEYQTYGQVPARLPEECDTFYWENKEKQVALRLNFRKDNQALTGVNGFGIRLRHEVFDRWIKEKKPIQQVLAQLHEAHFDPEFFRRYEPEIVADYNEKHPTTPITQVRQPNFWEKLFS